MMTRIPRTVRLYVGLFLVWSIFGLFMFSQGLAQKALSGDPTPWSHHLISWMVGVWVWFVLTSVVLWLGRRYPFIRGRYGRSVLLHLMLSAVISFAQLAIESGILRSLGVFPTIMTSYAATMVFLLILAYHQGLLTYWMILGVQFAFGWYSRYQERRQEAMRLQLHSSELEKQLVNAHLSALKTQLQPHFLFNTLNAIMVLVRQQKGREAEEMLARLSDLLRCVLEDVEAQEVPLSRELDYLQLYLSIEQVRFQDRMHVEFAVDPEALDAAVPHMALQPIVENAIRHGIGRSSSAGAIGISACRVRDKLEIRIEDDGPGLAPSNGPDSHGIGLANTRARLKQLYGDAAKLTVENGETAGVVATMLLPYRLAPAAAAPQLGEHHAFQGLTR